MSLIERVDRMQRAHPALGYPIAVLYKYFDDSGSYLAALITYYAFVSLFPLLLLGTTVLGFVLAGDQHLQQQILESAAGQIPVVGASLTDPKRLGGGTVGIIIGVLGALYGALGVAQAVQYAMNTAWTVPRNSRPNPFKARGRSFLLLATVGPGVVASAVLSTFGSGGAGSLGMLIRVVVLVGSVLLNAVVFTFAFRLATARPLTVRHVAPGAIAAAIVWQLLETFGATYVSHVIATASLANSVFALVLGLLAFLYVAAVSVILCVEANVVRVDRLHPRALLTPFTDNVELTGGDRRAYTRSAKAARNKGFEDIDVTFEKPAADD